MKNDNHIIFSSHLEVMFFHVLHDLLSCEVNPDSFHVNGQPIRTPRWRPPRPQDARRRPHVPLHRDFDSPSESEDDEQGEAGPSEGSKWQMRPHQEEAADSQRTSWPCGPHCCMDHYRNLAQGCTTLLEGLSSWRGAKLKARASRGLCKLETEDEVVEKLREVRECQLARCTQYQPNMRTRQRAS